MLVIDIGGGSTELILGGRAPTPTHSMDIGSVRLHERHLHSDPPSAAEVAACVADVEAALDDCPVDPSAAATVVGVAGTILSVVAGVLDLPAYDRDRIDQAVVPVGDVHAFVDRLVAMPVAERLALPWMHPGRADVIGAGALILSRVLRRARAPTMVVSESDILDGIAWSHRRVRRRADPFGRRGRWRARGSMNDPSRTSRPTNPSAPSCIGCPSRSPSWCAASCGWRRQSSRPRARRAGLGVGMFSAAGLLRFPGRRHARGHGRPRARPRPSGLGGRPDRDGSALRRRGRGGAGREEGSPGGDRRPRRSGPSRASRRTSPPSREATREPRFPRQRLDPR